jgi:predicted transposase/invertase (TIGR01784 family)
MKNMKELFSDMLFRTTFNGKEGYIYILFEHKSYLSPTTPLQLLKYMVSIWELTMNKVTNKLPFIIPLVYYHGKDKWNIDNNFITMIDGIEGFPESIKKYVPQYEHIIYDLSPLGDEEIKGGALLKIFLEISRAIFYKDPEEFIEVLERSIRAIIKLEQQDKGIDYFKTLVMYVMSARDDINMNTINKVVKNISLVRSDEIMTIAEQLFKEGMEKGIREGIKEGMEEGLQKGLQKGLQEGVIKGKKTTAKNLLKLGLPIEQVAKAAELSVEEVVQLKREIEGV